jgi:putative restriction endonuclease
MDWLSRHGSSRVDYAFTTSFEYDGRRIPLMDRQRGIRKPAGFGAALAIRTTYTPPNRMPPYNDEIGLDGLQRYKYRGTDPNHFENVALRRAMEDRLPLIWFVGVESGLYKPIFPVYVVGEERAQHQFALALDEGQLFVTPGGAMTEQTRRYVERVTRARLHQPVFRAQVLLAYADRCTVCSLHHPELLDAAHIIGDKEDAGDPVVTNGLAMCKIHHAAFDASILGVRPDLTLHIRQDILDEVDGPMLKHGLQAVHDQRLLVVPRSRAARPDAQRLEQRYAAFLRAG